MTQGFLGVDAGDKGRCLKGLVGRVLNGFNLHKTLEEKSKFV